MVRMLDLPVPVAPTLERLIQGLCGHAERLARCPAAILPLRMAQEDVDLVHAGFAALKRGDLDWFDDMTAPDLTIVQPPEVPDAKTYEGPGAMAAAMADWPSEWEDFQMELTEVVDLGDGVLISVTRHHGRGRESGIEMNFEVFYVHGGRDGKLARLEMYFSREQALDAAERMPREAA